MDISEFVLRRLKASCLSFSSLLSFLSMAFGDFRGLSLCERLERRRDGSEFDIFGVGVVIRKSRPLSIVPA
jgi:hypothetical protein